VRERRLTVSRLWQARGWRRGWAPRPDRVVPYLRMRGRWLEELGFEAGMGVAVEASPGRLVLTPVAAASEVAEAPAGEA
jgi:Toxin SymE, type I toxin-antitoxin system